MKMKIKTDDLVKIAGFLLTIAGTVVTGIASKRDTEKELAKLVDEKLKK